MRFPTAFLFRSSPHFRLLRCMTISCSLASRKATVKGCAELEWCILDLLNTASPHSNFLDSNDPTLFYAHWTRQLLTLKPSLFTRINTRHLLSLFEIRENIILIKNESSNSHVPPSEGDLLPYVRSGAPTLAVQQGPSFLHNYAP